MMSDALPDSAPSEAAASPVYLDAVLRPHRSLPPAGFAIIMALVGGVSFVAGMVFVLNGAWPVTGFFGLDVLLVYIAFRINYRSARRSEHVRLAGEALTVERISVRGERKHWRFEPFWLRVRLEEEDEHSNRLLLTSHGRSLTIASFLGAEERRQFAQRLKDALARWRAALIAS
jgi:uncharacterized membrane protein